MQERERATFGVGGSGGYREAMDEKVVVENEEHEEDKEEKEGESRRLPYQNVILTSPG